MTMLNHFFARLTVRRAVNDTEHDGARHAFPELKARAAMPFAIRWSALTFAIAFSSVMTLAGPPGETREGLTLQQCLELALKKNPALAVQTAKSAEAESDYRAARAGLLPKLSATGYANYLDEDRLSPAGSALPGVSLFGREAYGGLIARQLLFDGGKTTASRRAAAHGAKLKQMDLDAARDETVYQVSRAFFQAVEARELVPVAEEALKRQQQFETLTADFLKAGKATRLDGLKAEAARLDAERIVFSARELETLAGVRLAQMIGLDSDVSIRPAGELPRDFAQPAGQTDLVQVTLEQNPDLKSAALQMKQAEESVRSARGSYLPEVSLLGSYGYRDRDVGGGAPEWTIGAVASWSLFDGGLISAQVNKAKARLAQAEQSRRALELEVLAQMREALSAWRIAHSDLQAALKLVETGRESVKTAETLYRAGKATALDVLTAQADLARAEGTLVQIATGYAVSRARLLRLTGGKLETTSKP